MAYTETITILKDQQEKLKKDGSRGLSFGHYKDVNTTTCHLKQGDYWGALHTKYGTLMSRTIFERKSKDLWMSFTTNVKRLKNECLRAIKAGQKLVMIADREIDDVATKGYSYKAKGKLNRSPIAGTTILKTVSTFKFKDYLDYAFVKGEKNMKRHIVVHYMSECKGANDLLDEFNKTGDWALLDKLNRKVFLWA